MVWVNTWRSTQDASGVSEYPSNVDTFLQWTQQYVAGLFTPSSMFNLIPEYWQTKLVGKIGLLGLPPLLSDDIPIIKAALPNALHYRRGTTNTPVRNMEFQIPLMPYSNDSTANNFTVMQRAWWNVINLVCSYSERKGSKSSPLRLFMEMRVMGGSDIIMAAQNGNDFGTASIGIVSFVNEASDQQWATFSQEVADLWMSYGDELNVRPHWAKEWQNIKLKGVDASDYLRNVAYKDQIREFKSVLTGIGKTQNWTLSDLKDRFSNPLWDRILFP